MIKEIEKDADARMAKSVEAVKLAFSKIRTGRAHTSLLDHITVPYYGDEVPLNHVATVAVGDARTLTVTPWEQNMTAVVEKALIASDLGLNPASAGNVIRVPLPPLTEERRRDFTRIVRNEAEQARVAIRNIRRDANGDIRELVKEKEASEDEARRAEDAIQRITDKYIDEVDTLLDAKEQDLMEI